MAQKFKEFDITISQNAGVPIEQASDASLVAAIRLGFGSVPSTFLVYEKKNVIAAPYYPVDCWNEMYRRQGTRTTTEPAAVIKQSFQGRTVSATMPEVQGDELPVPEIKVATTKGSTDMVVFGGYCMVASTIEDEKVKAVVATTNAMEAMFMAQVSDPSETRRVADGVDPKKAAVLDFPLYPLRTAIAPANRAVAEYEFNLKKKELISPGFIVSLLSAFPRLTPKGHTVNWNGISFNIGGISVHFPKEKNQNSLFRTINMYREIRGADSGRRSLYTKGYYFFQSDAPTYTAMYVVNDLMNLVKRTGYAKFLSLESMSDIMTDFVLTSLVANGWTISIRNALTLSDYDAKDVRVASELKRGVFRTVRNCKIIPITYVPLNEPQPTLQRSTQVVGALDVNLASVAPRLKELIDQTSGGGVISYTYVYYRDELRDLTQYLHPTAHAHSGQLLFCSLASRKLSLAKYFDRVIIANAFKNMFVYTRQTFWPRDPFRYTGTFVMTQKIGKRRAGQATWTDADFQVKVVENVSLPPVDIDFQRLGQLNPVFAQFAQEEDRELVDIGEPVEPLATLDDDVAPEQEEHGTELDRIVDPTRGLVAAESDEDE